jgi:hypothetical protein
VKTWFQAFAFKCIWHHYTPVNPTILTAAKRFAALHFYGGESNPPDRVALAGVLYTVVGLCTLESS